MRHRRSHPDDRLPALEQAVVDQAMVDRLLDGRLGGAAVPPAYAPVLDVLDAARAPATSRELRGQAVAVAAYRANRRRRPASGPRMRSRALAIKSAVAAACAVSVVGVAAAATDILPGSGGRHDDRIGAALAGGSSTPSPAELDRLARTGLCEAVANRGDPAESGPAAEALATLAGGADRVGAYCGQAGATAGAHPPSSGGPDATGPARRGLCRAYPAGRGVELGGKASAVAFEALARAAGGTGRIQAYCAGQAGSKTDAPGGRSTPGPLATTAAHPGPAAPQATHRNGGAGAEPPAAPTSPPGHGGRPGS